MSVVQDVHNPEQLPLSRYPIVGTRSLEEAQDAVTRIYLPHTLRAEGDRINMSLNAADSRRMTVGYLTYKANAQVFMPPSENSYHVNLTTAGQTFGSRTDGERARTSSNSRGLIVSPIQDHTVLWEPGSEQRCSRSPGRAWSPILRSSLAPGFRRWWSRIWT